MRRESCAFWLALLLILAAGPRLAAVSYNAWPHGDVLLDAAIADAIVEQGELKIPLVDVRYYPIGRFGFGYPPDQHPPLWPLLGAAVRLAVGESYAALKIVSLVVGVLLVLAVYRAGRDLLGEAPARFAAALCAVSYLLIDFSGNGSLWGLLALLYVLFVWRAGCFPLAERRNAVILGLLMGAGYLTNYPAVILVASFLVLLAFRRWRGWGTGERRGAFLALCIAGLVVLPWLLFALSTFGNPFWSQPLQRQLSGGDKDVQVVIVDGEVVKRPLPVANGLAERLRTTAANLYGNVGFVARQSFVLMPFFGGFVLAGIVALGVRAARGQAGPLSALLVLTLAHLGLILLWPTTKFRYLVPLLPLAALAGSWLLWQIKPSEVRGLLAATCLGGAVFTSAWTWASIPSHTYYYDGGVVTDNFGGQGEIAYIDDLRHLERVAAAMHAAGPGVVLGPHPLYAMARQPLVINSDAFSREVVEHLVQRYAIRYVVAAPGRLDFYRSFLPGRLLWQDERYILYEVSR